MKQFTGEEIYRVIPNLYPLMIIDSLTVEPGVRATGYVHLTLDKWFFQCHFPGMPVMPAMLLLETMTQVFISTFLTERDELCHTHTDGYNWKQKDIPMLVQVSGFRMRQALHPGDTVQIDSKLHSFKRGIAQGKCEAFMLPVNGTDKKTLVTEFEVIHALPDMMTVPRLGEES